MAGAASTAARRAAFLPPDFFAPLLGLEAATSGILVALTGAALGLAAGCEAGFLSAGLFAFGAGFAVGVFFFATGLAFFGTGLRRGFLGFANLTLAGFFFDLVAIEQFVGRGNAPEDDRRRTLCRDGVSATR